jgi:hypothetical protein
MTMMLMMMMMLLLLMMMMMSAIAVDSIEDPPANTPRPHVLHPHPHHSQPQQPPQQPLPQQPEEEEHHLLHHHTTNGSSCSVMGNRFRVSSASASDCIVLFGFVDIDLWWKYVTATVVVFAMAVANERLSGMGDTPLWYVLRMANAYLLMLVVMSLEITLFLALLAGLGCGRSLMTKSRVGGRLNRADDSLVGVGTTPCCSSLGEEHRI